MTIYDLNLATDIDFFFFIIWMCFIFIFFLVFLHYLIKRQGFSILHVLDKKSIYECGFDTFDTILVKFDAQFFLIALLFLLFDIELIFIYPLLSVYMEISNFFHFFIFFFILLFGFLYEWYQGILFLTFYD